MSLYSLLFIALTNRSHDSSHTFGRRHNCDLKSVNDCSNLTVSRQCGWNFNLLGLIIKSCGLNPECCL